ncbi:unnamed protein product [Polarella glacialis]|uniref:Uncharacterized protein n=1 Tax=Polarella glacialis TaxID=89957 RepID=A0A813LFZ4_POLGL|nr:unnamed protein product [Polarella glacialis]CAE8614349.1 unnamed protein product [Polarella glacialis]CAE8729121.1 unnamed protein product [Polarella glacialis]
MQSLLCQTSSEAARRLAYSWTGSARPNGSVSSRPSLPGSGGVKKSRCQAHTILQFSWPSSRPLSMSAQWRCTLASLENTATCQTPAELPLAACLGVTCSSRPVAIDLWADRASDVTIGLAATPSFGLDRGPASGWWLLLATSRTCLSSFGPPAPPTVDAKHVSSLQRGPQELPQQQQKQKHCQSQNLTASSMRRHGNTWWGRIEGNHPTVIHTMPKIQPTNTSGRTASFRAALGAATLLALQSGAEGAVAQCADEDSMVAAKQSGQKRKLFPAEPSCGPCLHSILARVEDPITGVFQDWGICTCADLAFFW